MYNYKKGIAHVNNYSSNTQRINTNTDDDIVNAFTSPGMLMNLN